MATNEYRAHLKRGGRGYSMGHQIMYLVPLTLLHGTKQTILDVGFGIGWGLDQMVKHSVIRHYVGYEPDGESFDFVRKRHTSLNIELHNKPFTGGIQGKFDHVFCIEVIEHVPLEEHADFIGDLWTATGKTLWLSTPPAETQKHGVRTTDDWRGLLARQFENVTVHSEQWTTLYICQ